MPVVATALEFRLVDIDPSSIAPFRAFSLKTASTWSQTHAEPDRTVVVFKTQNQGKSISFYRGAEAADVSAAMVLFESKDNAERFVTAMKHAVTLCGGANGDFAPTPSH